MNVIIHMGYHKYVPYLSPFGNKVLENLIKHLESRNNSNRYVNPNRQRLAQNKRILTFGDSYISRPKLTEENEVVDQTAQTNKSYINNEVQVAQRGEVNLPIVPTSEILLQPVSCNDIVIKEPVVSNLDKIHINIEREPCLVPRINERLNTIHSDSNYVKDTQNQIEWSNMFDTDFLNDLDILESDENDAIHEDNSKIRSLNQRGITDKFETESRCNEIEVPKNVDMINIPKTNRRHNKIKDNGKNTSNLSTIIHEDSTIPENTMNTTTLMHENDGGRENEFRENVDFVKALKAKRKNSTKLTDTLPKKVKQSVLDQQKASYRKQTYTKTIKNWLNNVNANCEQVGEFPNLIPIVEETNKTEKKLDVSRNKKVVQAQLKNKGGIMKFEKPKKALDINKTTDGDVLKPSVAKEKKMKPKFVAPIKSQLPVRDISYVINCINDGNGEQYGKILVAIENQEIPMMLTFSNGFCQLNSHYTEDTCEVEGVMFQVHDAIYYWKGDNKSVCDIVKKIIINNTLICYDGKNVLKYFATHHELSLESTKITVLDTQIGGNLVDPDNPVDNFTGLQKLLTSEPEYTLATDCALQKSAWYICMLGESFEKLRGLLIENELWKVFFEIEMKVLPIITDMEIRGVHVDVEKLNGMENILLTRMKSIEKACHEAAGRSFQINSALQVRTILYEELQLDAKCNVRIRETVCKGEKSTSESMLRSLASVHPLPKLILEYRHLHKAHATFLAGIAHQVKDGVVRPTWVQTASATGRIASNNPNLQAIPKAPFSLVLFPDHGDGAGSSPENKLLNFRSVYIPREGHVLLAADFKHIECRVFACAAADTGLLDALNSPDLFRVLAAKWLNKTEEAVSSEDRERTKRIVYASLYGAGTRKLMEILDVSYEQALSVFSSFNRTFPSLKRFAREVARRGAGGRLATRGGRARRPRHLASADGALRARAQRQALNFIVQGTAADLCKLAMVETAARLGARCRLLLQIHDELVWELPAEDLASAAVTIKSVMENIGHGYGMPMRLPVSVSAGASWGQMEPFPTH